MHNQNYRADLSLWQAFAAYVPPHLANKIGQIKPPEYTGRKRWSTRLGTLLFADVAGFTAIWNSLDQSREDSGEELTYLLNHYFGDMLSVIQRHGGIPLKFGGDSLLAVFYGDEPAVWALACAAEMQRLLDAYRIVATSQGSFNLDMSVGLHSGPVRSAVLGEPRQRLEYLVSGPALRQALEAEIAASKGEALATEATYQAVQSHPDFKLEKVERAGQFYYRLNTAPWLPDHPHPQQTRPPRQKAREAAERLGRFVPDLVRQRLESNLFQKQHPRLESEHRVVTCFFIELHDPARLRPLALARYLEQLNELFLLMTRLVQQYGGSLARLDANRRGERLLLLFGAPLTNEDDANRALFCAWRFFIEKVWLGNGLKCRGGIATGPVFCTEVGAYWRKEYTIMGTSINLAARLASRAQADEIWLDEATFKAVESAGVGPFQRAEQYFKGFAGVLPVYVLKAPAQFQAHSPLPLPALDRPAPPEKGHLVGRVAEMQRFHRQLSRCNGQGALIALHSPAGYGKSTLVAWFVQNWQSRPRTGPVLQASARAYNQLMAYQPWLSLLPGLTGLVPPPQEQTPPDSGWVERLRWLAPETLERDGWTLDYLLGQGPALPNQSYRDRGEIFKRSFFRLWQELLTAVAERFGMPLLVLDNLQWADPLSLELLENLAGQVERLPVFFCALGRSQPSGNAPVAGPEENSDQANYDWLEAVNGFEIIQLPPFKRAEVQLFLGQLLGVRQVPASLVRLTLERTGGNPFYIEELVRMLRQAGQLSINPDTGRCRWQADRGGTRLAVTASLQSLIISGLDQLAAPEQEVLQAAAVVGNEIDERRLKPLVSPGLNLPHLLSALNSKDWLVVTEQKPGGAVYSFKQQLVQQAIYERLAFARRRQLHRKLARFLEESGGADSQLELLAYHYGRSDLGQTAFEYLCRAGQKAFGSYAYLATLTYFEQALDWLKRLQLDYYPAALLQLYREGGIAARVVGQYSQALTYFEELLKLARYLNDIPAQVSGLNGLVSLNRISGEFEAALELARQALSLSGQVERPELLAETYDYLGGIYFFRQEYNLALAQFEQAYRLNQTWLKQLGPEQSGAREVAWQLLSQCLGNIGLVYAVTGQFGRAYRHLREAFELVNRLKLKYFMTTLSINLGELCQLLFQGEPALDYHRQALNLSREIGARDLEAEALRNLGMDYRLTGQYRQAEECLWEALDLVELNGNGPVRRQILENLAAVMLEAGKILQVADLLEQLVAEEASPGVQRLQAALLVRQNQLYLATRLQEALIAQVEASGGERHLLWQLYWELAQFEARQRAWLPHVRATRRAWELLAEVGATLAGCELAEAFNQSGPVHALQAAYRFVCEQEELNASPTAS